MLAKPEYNAVLSGRTHVWEAIRPQVLIGDDGLDAAALDLCRGARVGAVLGQGHAIDDVLGSVRSLVLFDPIGSSIRLHRLDRRFCRTRHCDCGVVMVESEKKAMIAGPGLMKFNHGGAEIGAWSLSVSLSRAVNVLSPGADWPPRTNPWIFQAMSGTIPSGPERWMGPFSWPGGGAQRDGAEFAAAPSCRCSGRILEKAPFHSGPSSHHRYFNRRSAHRVILGGSSRTTTGARTTCEAL